MTSEAALAKLSYVLGQPGLSVDDRKEVRAPQAVGTGPGCVSGFGKGAGIWASPWCQGSPQAHSPALFADPGPFTFWGVSGLAHPEVP